MLQRSRKLLWLGVASLLALGVAANAARAQDANADDLRTRIERLEKQNQELMNALKAVTPAPGPRASIEFQDSIGSKGGGVGKDEVQKIVQEYMKTEAEKKAGADAEKKQRLESEGYRIGSDLGVTAKFNEYGNLWFKTANNDFTMHPGAWTQFDNYFYDQTNAMRANPGARSGRAQGVASGVAQGGIGDLQDGVLFRRLRPFVEGTFYENYEYRLNFALENIQNDTTGLDEFWVAINKLPLIGTIRIGHVKTLNGFEADQVGSSRTMTFLERASYTESIYLNQNFVTGVWLNNNFLDQHATYTASVFRNDVGNVTGAQFGDGQFGAAGRLTALPIWDCEGRHFLHLGTSVGWRNGQNNIANSPFRTFQLRSRPELRDDDPAASPAGAPAIANANSNRMVDTGPIAARDDYILGLELCYVRGPFTFQAEYGWNHLEGAFGVAPAGLTLNPPIVPAQSYTFGGGYVQVAYTLTGESRAYDKARGALAREYYKTGPLTNAWFVRDEQGLLNWGLGAVELAARYSYVNLNDGSGVNRIQGGAMDGVTLGLNWWLNPNMSIQFDYVYDRRYDLPTGSIPGYTSGFGTRVQLTF